MDKNVSIDLYSNKSESILIFPFKSIQKIDRFDEYLYKKGGNNPIVLEADGDNPSYQHFTKHIRNIIGNDDKSICRRYRLTEECRTSIGIQSKGSKLKLLVNGILKSMGGSLKKEYNIALGDISYMYFTTQIGMFFITVLHDEDEPLGDIVDKMHCLTHCYVKRNRKKIFYEDENGVSGYFSDIIQNAFGIINKENEDEIEFFPNSNSRQAYSFQRIIVNCVAGTDAEKAELRKIHNKASYCLKNGFYNDYSWRKQYTRETKSDYLYKPSEVLSIGVCQMGMVALTSVNENSMEENFIRHIFPYNFRNGYFMMYLLKLHQRIALLEQAEKSTIDKSYVSYVQINEWFIEFDKNYSINVISDQPTYQTVFEGINEVMGIEVLERELRTVSEKVTQHEADARRRGIDNLIIFATIVGILGLSTQISNIIEVFDVKVSVAFKLGIVGALAVIVLWACWPFIANWWRLRKKR